MLSLSDELEFAAIQAIHRQLDDNEDGKVDLSESEEVGTHCTCISVVCHHMLYRGGVS